MRLSLAGTMVFLGLATLAGGCSSTTGNGDTSSGGAVTKAGNQEFCADTAGTPRSGTPVEVCGVGLLGPTAELKRAESTKEFAGTGAPQVGCFSPTDPTYPKAVAAGTSVNVTVNG